MCSNIISQAGMVKHYTIHSRYLMIVWWLWSVTIQVTGFKDV